MSSFVKVEACIGAALNAELIGISMATSLAIHTELSAIKYCFEVASFLINS